MSGEFLCHENLLEELRNSIFCTFCHCCRAGAGAEESKLNCLSEVAEIVNCGSNSSSCSILFIKDLKKFIEKIKVAEKVFVKW